MKNKNRKEWKRSGKFDDHHIVNESRGGIRTPSNLLRMDTRKHSAFHLIFGNLDLDEIIALLQRVREIKASKERVYL